MALSNVVNSETGHQDLKVEPRTFRVQCANGMVTEELMTRQIHLGNGDNGFDEEVYLSIRRSIRERFSRFGEIILALRETTEIEVRNPQKVINNVVKHHRLSEEQKGNILMAFGAEPEADQHGIPNAVTTAAHLRAHRARLQRNSWLAQIVLRGAPCAVSPQRISRDFSMH